MTRALRPRLRVLLITHELSLTGAPRLAGEIVRTLGTEIDLRTISGAGGGLEASLRESGPVDVLSSGPRWLGDVRHPAGIIAAKAWRRLRAPLLGARARRWRPDVVYGNSAAAIALIPRLGLDRFPVLLHVHELTMGFSRLTERQRHLVRTVPDRYVAVSQVVAEELVRGQGIDRDRIVVVQPLVDGPRIINLAGGSARDASTDSQPPFVIGGAGNPHWTKGIELWLLMARDLLDRLGADDVRFRWVGIRDNQSGAELRSMVEKLGLGGHVDLVAETANPYPYFRQSDVFAMTSWEEAAPLVVLEHMALGVPVVCFRHSGGPAEEVRDSQLIVEQFSPAAMAELVAALVRDPNRRARLAREGRVRAEASHSPQHIADAMSAALREVALRNRDQAGGT